MRRLLVFNDARHEDDGGLYRAIFFIEEARLSRAYAISENDEPVEADTGSDVVENDDECGCASPSRRKATYLMLKHAIAVTTFVSLYLYDARRRGGLDFSSKADKVIF